MLKLLKLCIMNDICLDFLKLQAVFLTTTFPLVWHQMKRYVMKLSCDINKFPQFHYLYFTLIPVVYLRIWNVFCLFGLVCGCMTSSVQH